MKYKIWNKIDDINDINADIVIESHRIKEKDEVFLILDKMDNVTEIQIKNTIISGYDLDVNLTVEEVAQKYIEIKEQEKIQIEKDQVTLEEVTKKISILEAENKALKESQDIQDRTIVENDMRMMDIEWALEDLILTNNLDTKINLTEVFNMRFGRSATYFNQLKQMIERENYDSKEEMERILNKYKSGRNPRITQEEYDQLFDLLYPPVYDIPTTIPEV